MRFKIKQVEKKKDSNRNKFNKELENLGHKMSYRESV